MKSRTECLAEYGSDYMIQQKVNSGELFKIGKAVYSEEKDVPELAVLVFIYPPAKRTPSIGAVGYHRMGGDEFAPYGMTPKVFLPCIFSPIF